MKTQRRILISLIFLGLFISACSAEIPEEANSVNEPQPTNVEKTTPPPTYDIPGWNKLIPFDAIHPVYDPEFLPPDIADLQEDELIMGVAWEGKAKAYPVTVLRGREMVNDEMTGIPYLVSW